MVRRPRVGESVGDPLVRVRTELLLDGSGLAALGVAALSAGFVLADDRQGVVGAFGFQAAVVAAALSAFQLYRLRRANVRSAPADSSVEGDGDTMRRVTRRLVVLTPVLAAITAALEAFDPGQPPSGVVAGSLVGVGLALFLSNGWVARWEREHDLVLLAPRPRFALIERLEWSERRTYYTARPGSLPPPA
jgi:hypothetical protein